ncbi:methyltransferase domain-containing protein [Desulfovibrio sp. OttesenSCG-928-G15]|nr:methyltransferase domain-containing protein [Desulfovibrio sp. OttesenSCG-928-G15]
MDIATIQELPFVRLWKNRESESACTESARRFWDLRADEFNKITHAVDREERYELVRFLEDRGALAPGGRVLDLGCGAGRYALEFARRGLAVTGIDISPKMIAHAKRNVAEAGLGGCEFFASPWEQLDCVPGSFTASYDLVFASMSSAVHDEATLLRFHAASRGYCFLSGFIHRRDLLLQRLSDAILQAGELPAHEGSIYFAFNVLWQNGIYADCLCRHSGWTHTMSVEACVEAYRDPLAQRGGMEAEKMEELLHRELAPLARGGQVEREVKSRVGWLFWSADKR